MSSTQVSPIDTLRTFSLPRVKPSVMTSAKIKMEWETPPAQYWSDPKNNLLSNSMDVEKLNR